MHDSGDTGPPWTVEEFAAVAGMTVRNIRAYATRDLLPPPLRRGRRVLYDERHLQRVQAVRRLLDQGMTLRAITAAIRAHDTGGADQVAQDFAMSLGRVLIVEAAVVTTADAADAFGQEDGALDRAIGSGRAVDLGDGQVLLRNPVAAALCRDLGQAGFSVPSLLALADRLGPALADLAQPLKAHMGRPELLIPDPQQRAEAMSRHAELLAFVLLEVLDGMASSPVGPDPHAPAAPPDPEPTADG